MTLSPTTSRSPFGTAGGDLTGSYPNPTIPDKVTGGQAAIAGLNLGVLVLLTDAITAIGMIQTKVNTLLAELRTAGLITP